MARVNQGYFNQIKKDFKEIENEFEDINIKTLDSDGKLDYNINDIEILWGRLDSFDDIYVNCIDLKVKVANMLDSQKFEMTETEDSYNQIIDDLDSIARDMVSNFSDTKYNINLSCSGGFSDSEKSTLNNYKIQSQ